MTKVSAIPKAFPQYALSEEIVKKVDGAIHANKVLIDEIDDSLSEYIQALNEASDAAAIANEVADKPSKLLYLALSRGVLDKAEVSEKLGEAFGFKTKQDGTPSKTPAGEGERIRKRVVQASQAYAIAEGKLKGEDLPRWAQGVEASEIAEVVKALEDESEPISLYTACDKLSRLKPSRGSVALPFDPKRLSAIAASLSDPEQRAKIAESAALREAYLAIAKALPILTSGPDAGQVDWAVQDIEF